MGWRKRGVGGEAGERGGEEEGRKGRGEARVRGEERRESRWRGSVRMTGRREGGRKERSNNS